MSAPLTPAEINVDSGAVMRHFHCAYDVKSMSNITQNVHTHNDNNNNVKTGTTV